MRVREDYRSLSGPDKAALLLMSVGDENAARMFALMDDEEIKDVLRRTDKALYEAKASGRNRVVS